MFFVDTIISRDLTDQLKRSHQTHTIRYQWKSCLPRRLSARKSYRRVKAKVLINEEIEQYDLNPSNILLFRISPHLSRSDFKSKKMRVNLNRPVKAGVMAESSEVLKIDDDDQKHVIQATIVRIMKTRKTMKNQALIQEVISRISQQFTPRSLISRTSEFFAVMSAYPLRRQSRCSWRKNA